MCRKAVLGRKGEEADKVRWPGAVGSSLAERAGKWAIM